MKSTKKLKRMLAAALAAVMVISGAVTAMAAEVGEYPLMGKLDSLGLGFATKIYYNSYDSSTGQLSDPEVTYVFENSLSNMSYDEIMTKCNAEGTLKYYGITSEPVEMVAIALLAGEQIAMNPGDPGLYFDGMNAELLQKGYELADNVRLFLGTFENGWENASDYEKVVHICKWIRLAKYDSNTGVGGTYACLINKATDCSGYTSAAMFLSEILGIECFQATDIASHVYPVFKVNGVWLSYDPSVNGDNVANAQSAMQLQLFDMYNRTGAGNQSFLQYFENQGYVVPDDLRDYFPSDYCRQIAGKNFGDGNHSIYGALDMHDDCGHFPYNATYNQ